MTETGNISVFVTPLIHHREVCPLAAAALALSGPFQPDRYTVRNIPPGAQSRPRLTGLSIRTLVYQEHLLVPGCLQGLTNVKSSVLLALWDIFHANDIEFAFPQRDLHIKSAVPSEISGS